jgi:hypothetical protein
MTKTTAQPAADSKVLRPAARKPPNAGKGRVKGVPNKVTGELKEMILQALAGAGGVDYLMVQARETPTAFLTLVGKVLPLQVTGENGKPLIPPGGVTFVVRQAEGAVNRT